MSAENGNAFEQRFTNQLDSLLPVIEAAVRFLEERKLSDRAVNLARLAIEEMATNILKYGYDDPGPHEILLQVQLEPGGVMVVLEDDGHEFNPLEAPPPDLDLPFEEREPGKMGIYLVRRMAKQMDYQRCAGRNRLTIRIAA
jgi:anti-sigma regulatory factor (Ser/Thr protein kinase)